MAYHEFDPYGSPVEGGGEPYGFSGEWWEDEVGLLYLRARWYQPAVGIFVSRDPVKSEPPYQYVRGNPVNLIDPSGRQCEHHPLCKDPLYPLRELWEYGQNTIAQASHDFGEYSQNTIAQASRHFGDKILDWIMIDEGKTYIIPNYCTGADVSDGFAAFTVKQRPGKFNAQLSATTPSGPVSEECYMGLSGRGCQTKINLEGPVAPGVVIGGEVTVGEPGGKGYVGADVVVAEAEFSMGSEGVGLELGAKPLPGTKFAAEVSAIPPTTPNFPYPHLTAFFLPDALYNGGLHAWFAEVTGGEEISGLVLYGDSHDDLVKDFQRTYYSHCFSLWTYRIKSSGKLGVEIYPKVLYPNCIDPAIGIYGDPGR